MADLLYVTCPHWGQGATTTHDTARAAAATALVWDDGARVVVLDARAVGLSMRLA